MMPGMESSGPALAYLWTPWTREEAQFPTPMIATLICPNRKSPGANEGFQGLPCGGLARTDIPLEARSARNFGSADFSIYNPAIQPDRVPGHCARRPSARLGDSVLVW